MTGPQEPAEGAPRPGWQPDFAPPPGTPPYPQTGTPSYPQPGPPSYPQAGPPSYPQPSPPSYPQPGPPSYPQPGPAASPQPGPASFPPPAGPPQVLSCYRHPGRPTGVRCQRCGRPICGACMVAAPVGYQCPECVQVGLRETRQYQVSRRSRSQTTTVTLLAMNLVLFAATFVTGRIASPLFGLLALTPTGMCERGGGYYTGGTPESCAAFGGNWVPGVADGAVWQILTSAFMHLDVTHIAFNMFALWVLGPQLEAFLGHARYLALYLVSAFAGSAAVMWFAPPTTTTVGASGALFGLMGALLVVVWRQGGDVRNILFWVGANLVFTFMVSGISWQGHLGGLVGGLLAAAAISLPGRKAGRTSWALLVGLGVFFVVASLVRIPLL